MDGDHTMTSQDEASLADLPHVNDDDPTSDDLDTGLLDRDNFDDDYGLEGLDQDALFAAHENEDVGGDTSSKSAFAAPTIHGRDSPSGLPSPSKTPFHDSHGSSQLDENTSEPFQERYDWAGLLGDFRVRLQQNRAEDMALQQRFDRLVEFHAVYRSMGIHHEEERLAKRLCTRIAYVQHAEHRLQHQRAHYDRVCSAFQGALDLLEPQDD